MPRLRGLLGPALLALIGLFAGQARAEIITMTIVDEGVTHILSGAGPLVDGVPTSTSLTANVAALNLLLVADGSAYQFGSLGAGSNFPGASTAGTLGLSGLVTIAPGSTGSTDLTITVTESGFTSPSGATGTLTNSGTANYANTSAGDSQTFSATYNGTVTAPSITQTSTGPGLNPHSDSDSAPILPFVTPYSLTSFLSLSMTANPAGGTIATNEFSALASVSAVPEPASLALLGIGMSGFFVFRRFFRKPSVVS